MAIDHNTKVGLLETQDRLNGLLDHVIIYRQLAAYKADYRFVSNKVQKALTAVNEALERIEQ